MSENLKHSNTLFMLFLCPCSSWGCSGSGRAQLHKMRRECHPVQIFWIFSLLACTGNTELYYSFIGSCFASYLQWPRLPVSNLSAKQLKHNCTFSEDDLGNLLAGTNSTPWAHASSNPPSSYRTREQNIMRMCLKLELEKKSNLSAFLSRFCKHRHSCKEWNTFIF